MKLLNYGDDAPIDLKEGLNIPAGKPIQAADQLVLQVKSYLQQVLQFNG